MVSNADHADSHRPADAASAREGALVVLETELVAMRRRGRVRAGRIRAAAALHRRGRDVAIALALRAGHPALREHRGARARGESGRAGTERAVVPPERLFTFRHIV